MTGLAAVALGQHDHRAAGRLELVDVGVHPAGRRRAERAGRACPRGSWPGRRSRRRGRAGTAGIGSPASSRSLILACAMSRATTSGPVSDSRVFTGYLRQLGADLVHRPVEVDRATTSSSRCSSVTSGRKCAGSVSSCSRKTPSGVIFAERLAVGRAGHRDRDRAARRRAAAAGPRARRGRSTCRRTARRCRTAWVSSRTSASSSRSRNAVPGRRARGRQPVEVAGAGVLRGLERVLGAGAADDDGQVVRRAGGGAERAQLLVEEAHHRRRG